MQEYRYRDSLVIGVDHGYGNMKTAHRVFPASVTEDPQYGASLLTFEGKDYGIGGGHKDFQICKTLDADYYLLTLAAIAEELRIRGKHEENLFLAAGLPLHWVKEQKEDFRAYLLQNHDVKFEYREEAYHITIAGAEIFPQGFAAIAPDLRNMQGLNMLADIGNGTMNVMLINNGKPVEGGFFTEQFGTWQCMKLARNELVRTCGRAIPDMVIENVIRNGTSDISEEVLDAIRKVAEEYVRRVFAKLRDYGYYPDLMKLYIVGGGQCLVSNFGQGLYDPNRTVLIKDICATAKDYEALAYGSLCRGAVREGVRK